MLETVLALSALIEIVCAKGAVPVVQGFVPSDVAMFPGSIVIVQEVLAASDALQSEVAVVPAGQVG